MHKLNQLARQFLGRYRTPATPPAPAAPATAAPAAAPAADAPLPPWAGTDSRQYVERFYPRVIELPDAQGYLALRFYLSECRRTLMTTRRLPLPELACLAGPLFAAGDLAAMHACGHGDQQPVQRNFRYVLPPIFYAGHAEMEAILQRTHQEVARLLENYRLPALPREVPVPEEAVELLPPAPPDWLDAPPVDVTEGPPPELEEQHAAPADPAQDNAPENKTPIEVWTGVIEKWLPKGDKTGSEGWSKSPLLCVRDEAKGGERSVIRGQDLLKAMQESQARVGDRVQVIHKENAPVEVYQNGARKRGAYKKLFKIQVLEQRMPGR